ncbi:hypothetical protein [Minwuia sp.]|uniref:hypothetical protein n=1 Tax=Minwuia sp. TaxID=2493630 RepID=UPI003A933351
MYLLDSVVQHFRRDTKRDAGIALPDAAIRRLPENMAQPKAVLWDRRTEDKPALLYVFDVPGDPRLGKAVVRVEFRERMNGQNRVQNSITSAGMVERRNLADTNIYELIEGRL